MISNVWYQYFERQTTIERMTHHRIMLISHLVHSNKKYLLIKQSIQTLITNWHSLVTVEYRFCLLLSWRYTDYHMHKFNIIHGTLNKFTTWTKEDTHLFLLTILVQYVLIQLQNRFQDIISQLIKLHIWRHPNDKKYI